MRNFSSWNFISHGICLFIDFKAEICLGVTSLSVIWKLIQQKLLCQRNKSFSLWINKATFKLWHDWGYKNKSLVTSFRINWYLKTFSFVQRNFCTISPSNYRQGEIEENYSTHISVRLCKCLNKSPRSSIELLSMCLKIFSHKSLEMHRVIPKFTDCSNLLNSGKFVDGALDDYPTNSTTSDSSSA